MMPQGSEADRSGIISTLHAYQAALNAADTNAVLPLYEPDGVFMQPHGPSAIGTDAIRQTYDADFRTFRLQVTFQVAEVQLLSPEWAFVRTNSAGTNTVLATGAQSAEANQELFILHKGVSGSWKIARYSFSTTNPPHA
ncbi:MAG: YybH family protein [Janthinobacterium lividum]